MRCHTFHWKMKGYLGRLLTQMIIFIYDVDFPVLNDQNFNTWIEEIVRSEKAEDSKDSQRSSQTSGIVPSRDAFQV